MSSKIANRAVDVPGGVVIQLKERDGEELHIFGDGEDFWMGINNTKERAERKEGSVERTNSFQAFARRKAFCTLLAWLCVRE